MPCGCAHSVIRSLCSGIMHTALAAAEKHSKARQATFDSPHSRVSLGLIAIQTLFRLALIPCCTVWRLSQQAPLPSSIQPHHLPSLLCLPACQLSTSPEPPRRAAAPNHASLHPTLGSFFLFLPTSQPANPGGRCHLSPSLPRPRSRTFCVPPSYRSICPSGPPALVRRARHWNVVSAACQTTNHLISNPSLRASLSFRLDFSLLSTSSSHAAPAPALFVNLTHPSLLRGLRKPHLSRFASTHHHHYDYSHPFALPPLPHLIRRPALLHTFPRPHIWDLLLIKTVDSGLIFPTDPPPTLLIR